MITLYGIKNCDSCQKAKKWLTLNKINHTFHDFRQDGLNEDTLMSWSTLINLELCLNRRSITWRNLSGIDKNTINGQNIINYFLKYPTLIKRPILKNNNSITVGFDPDVFTKELK